MITFIRKTGMFVVRGTLAFCALIFLVLIAIQIILIVGVNLVAAGHGSSFFERQLNEAIGNTGYSVAFDALYYDPVRGFSVYDLSVSDKEGSFLTLDRFSIGAYFTFSSLKAIDMHARGGNLSIDRIPVFENNVVQDEKEHIEPFATPDIYFRTVTISNFSFDEIKIGEKIAGNEYKLSPSLQARIVLTDKIDLSLKLNPGLAYFAEDIQTPEMIEVEGSFTSTTLDFILRNFSLSADDYQINAKASGNIGSNGTIDMTADASHNALSSITGGALSKAEAQASIIGPLMGPALNLSALVAPDNLKERGLSDIKITLQTADITEGMKGLARIETSFKDDPVTLESLLSYEAPLLHVSGIKGAAPAISIDGGGTLSTDTMLFDGEINLSASDLSRYADFVNVKISGKMAANAKFKPSEALEQSADITAKIDNLAYDTFSIRSLSAAASFASLSTPWPQSAKADISALKISDSVSFNTLSANIADAGNARYTLSMTGKGNIPSAVSFDGSSVLSNLTHSIPNADDIDFSIKHGASTIKIGGVFHQDQMDITLSAKDFRGNDIPASIPSQLEDMRIDLNAAIFGAPSSPESNVTATIRGIGAGVYQNASVTAKAQHDGKNVSAQLEGNGTGIRKLKGEVSLPLTLSLVPFEFSLKQDAPLTGMIDADIDLAAVSSLFLSPAQNLSGSMNANGTISGTLSSPKPAANIRIADTKFEDDANGVMIDKITATAQATDQVVIITSLSATDGKEGRINGNGRISLNGGKTDASLRIHNFNITHGDMANGFLGADLSLSGSVANEMMLSGKIDIAEMHVLIPEKFSSSIPQLNIIEDEKETGPSFLDRLALDIQIDAHNQVFVRGWGLDAEFGGEVSISGKASKPQMNGDLASIRGRFEEFGKRFTLAKANLRFQGNVPPSPYLDIEATMPAGDVTGSVLLTGPVTAPAIKFASNPALPEDEVLSRILFGKNSARISPFQAVQLAQTIRRFSGEGSTSPGLDPLGMIRGATGLDDISVELDDTGAANVGVGKYLSDNVYLELGAGKAENSGEATITIEVTPSINVESRIGQDAQGGGGVFWKHDY